MALSTSASTSPNYSYQSCTRYSCPSQSATYGVPLSNDNNGQTCTFSGTYNPTGLGNQAVTVNCYYQNGQLSSSNGNGETSMCPRQLQCTGSCNGRTKFDNGQCGSCPSSYSPNGSTCTYTCPDSTFISPGDTSMPPTCSPCNDISSTSTASYTIDSSSGQCVPATCNGGYGLNGQNCNTCDAGQYSPTPSSACQSCPSGQVPTSSGRSCETITCPAGQGVSGNGCQSCSGGTDCFFCTATVSPGGPGAVCQACSGATVPNDDNTACVALSCDPGYGINESPFGTFCEQCTASDGEYSPGGSSECMQCPTNGVYTVPNADATGCVPLDNCPAGQGPAVGCYCPSSTNDVCDVDQVCSAYCLPCASASDAGNMYSSGGSQVCQTCAAPYQVNADNSACNAPPSVQARIRRNVLAKKGLAGKRAPLPVPAKEIPSINRKRFDTWA